MVRPRPWLMLWVVVFAQTATTIVTVGPAFLIPMLHLQRGLSLAEAGLLFSAAGLGGVLTLVAWGWATDRWGERRVLLVGLSATVVSVTISALVDGFVWIGLSLVLTGAMAVCVNASSGRLVVGWFPPERRGLAMGIRQSCQPLGTAIGSLVIPPLASGIGIWAALAFGGVLVLIAVVAIAFTIVDPARPSRTDNPVAARNPYRGSSRLLRVHLTSVVLVVPQFALSTYGLVWFMLGFGWSELQAGLVVAAAQLLGAVGRILAGVLSDRVGSRLRPMRWVAIAGIAALLVTAAFGLLGWDWASAIAYVLASTISVATNGLAFTAVAELAGPHWAGRALGMQNTGQYLTGSFVPPLIGALIAAVGYPWAWAIVAIAPIIATPLVPRDKPGDLVLDTEAAAELEFEQDSAESEPRT